MAQTAAERRAAQRRTAREVRTGTYKPSAAGARSRKLAAIRRMADQIRDYQAPIRPNYAGRDSRFDMFESGELNADIIDTVQKNGIDWTYRRMSAILDDMDDYVGRKYVKGGSGGRHWDDRDTDIRPTMYYYHP